jgi:hypothetical protein
MTPEQFRKFKSIINHESKKAMNDFLDAEIAAMPEDKERTDFMNGIRKSNFFNSFFERGFIEGIAWNKKVAFVIEGGEK